MGIVLLRRIDMVHCSKSLKLEIRLNVLARCKSEKKREVHTT